MSDLPSPLTGEVVRCAKCGRSWTSNPEKSGGWIVLDSELEDGRIHRAYICPACMGADPNWWKTHKKGCNCGKKRS